LRRLRSKDWDVAEVGAAKQVGNRAIREVQVYCNGCGRMISYDLKKMS